MSEPYTVQTVEFCCRACVMKQIRKDLWKRHRNVAISLCCWAFNCHAAYIHKSDFAYFDCVIALLMAWLVYFDISKHLWPLYLIHKAVKQMPVGATAIKIHYYYE